MKYLVDANVLSEPTKPQSNAQVQAWLRQHENDLVVDPIILGEIRFGILVLPSGKRRERLEHWYAQGIESMTCLPWSAKVGQRWAVLLADLRKAGRAMAFKDSMIAATALTHRLMVVTRNEQHFQYAGVRLINPFGF